MKVGYKNSREEIFYQSRDALVATHGVKMAEKICQRISELGAATNPQCLPKNTRFHEYKGKRKGLFSIDLVHPYRLIIEPTCAYNNWYEIISVRIYEIIDPH